MSPLVAFTPHFGSWSQTLPVFWSSQGFLVIETFSSAFSASWVASFCVWLTRLGTVTLLLLTPPPPNIHFPIRIAPTRTSTPATTSKIVEVFDFFCWRRRAGRSS